jgi:hypothetical protein
MILYQKDQGKKLRKIDTELPTSAGLHNLEQQARGIYIASIYQLEAAYDLSVTA